MLVKRIDLGAIPNGLYVTGEDIPKGSAVVMKNGKVYLPSTKDEAEKIFGLATLFIDEPAGGDMSHHNVIKAGSRAVVYTLVKNNMWGTTEFVGKSFNAGDSVSVAYAEDNRGKLIKSGKTANLDDAEPLFEVFEVSQAGSYPMLEVYVR